MEAFVPFLTVLSVVLPVSVCSVLIARIYRKNAALDPKITNKLRRQQEEYIAELEHGKRKLQNKLNSMQAGPKVEGDIDDMGGNNRIVITTTYKPYAEMVSSTLIKYPNI